MNHCRLELIGVRDGLHVLRCRDCGTRYVSKRDNPATFRATCPIGQSPPPTPRLLDDDQVEARLAVCRACDAFAGDGYCKLCSGCTSSRNAHSFRRVASDRRAKCPKGIWPAVREKVVVNLDRIGWGDLAIFAYLQLGTRNDDRQLVIGATGERARHARLLGCEPDDPAKDPTEWTAFTAEMEHLHSGGTTGRLEFYADHYGVPRHFEKPRLEIPHDDLGYARSLGIDRQTVLFFPDSLAPNRVWPHKHYWNELGERLSAAGLKWLALPIRNAHLYQHAADVRPMVRVAACMSLAGLAIGNDSAGMNWTPLVDLPALCLLGPTRPEVFSHAPLIRCLTPRTPLRYNAAPEHPAGADCNGCCYHFKHGHLCTNVCMSLANLLPAEVAQAAIAYHREHWS